jgi:hypothetical protein
VLLSTVDSANKTRTQHQRQLRMAAKLDNTDEREPEGMAGVGISGEGGGGRGALVQRWPP